VLAWIDEEHAGAGAICVGTPGGIWMVRRHSDAVELKLAVLGRENNVAPGCRASAPLDDERAIEAV
jgi:hypothetical protein